MFENIDLTTVSAADFLAALDEMEETEENQKTASEVVSSLSEEDLHNMSAQDLAQLLEAVEAEEVSTEKVAALQNGDYDGYALAGEVMGTAMAEAFATNMSKLADETAPEEDIDLSKVSAADFLEALSELEEEVA